MGSSRKRFRHRARRIPAPRLGMGAAFTLIFAACSNSPVTASVYGLPAEEVSVESRDLGYAAPDAWALRARDARYDGASLLAAADCTPGCHATEVTLYFRNPGPAPWAPPVARLPSPPGRPARLPLAFGGTEVSPGRVGRLRLLILRWPEEKSLHIRLSSSVRLVLDSAKEGAPALKRSSPP